MLVLSKLRTVSSFQKLVASSRDFHTTLPKNDYSERMIRYRADVYNVRQAGEGDHVVLCLPGLMGTIQTDFGKIFDMMDQTQFRLVCWDPPGHGKTRPPHRDHKGDYYKWDARLIAAVMKVLDYEKYSVLGWCTGGTTANALAADYAEHVDKMVIWGAVATMDEFDIEQANLLKDRENWPNRLPNYNTSMATYGHDYLKKCFTNWADSVKEMVEWRDWNKLHNRPIWIKCPTLVLHGENDPFVKLEQAKFFEKNIDNSELHIIKGAKHDLHLTHTEQFLELVEEFLLREEEEPQEVEGKKCNGGDSDADKNKAAETQ